jgi:hypothetical protein
MKTMIIIIMLMNGSQIFIPINNSNSFADCDKHFTKITYNKTITNYKNKKQIGTFYKDKEVLLYKCIWE